MHHRLLLPLYILTCFFLFFTFTVGVANDEPVKEDLFKKRMNLYLHFSNELVPWYHLAAIDQFERNIQDVRPDLSKTNRIISIQFSNEDWAGALNPNSKDSSPASIAYFNGMGLDGSGDGFAKIDDDRDIIFTMATYLSNYGARDNDFKKALSNYYKKEETVNQIVTISKLYRHFDTLDLDEHAFPIPVQHHYTYRGTWGASRGWGGRRIHEGTDLFAGYGVPVQSTAYGIVEVLGWNEYGGWRVGIRDIHNTYHYFAHLAYFDENIKEGDIVEPRTIIGYVGNTGYGPKGTAGKFPPHLHYGMYKYNGKTEWAFDPYPSLRNWEQHDKKANK